jgi:hypothetical protein
MSPNTSETPCFELLPCAGTPFQSMFSCCRPPPPKAAARSANSSKTSDVSGLKPASQLNSSQEQAEESSPSLVKPIAAGSKSNALTELLFRLVLTCLLLRFLRTAWTQTKNIAVEEEAIKGVLKDKAIKGFRKAIKFVLQNKAIKGFPKAIKGVPEAIKNVPEAIKGVPEAIKNVPEAIKGVLQNKAINVKGFLKQK